MKYTYLVTCRGCGNRSYRTMTSKRARQPIEPCEQCLGFRASSAGQLHSTAPSSEPMPGSREAALWWNGWLDTLAGERYEI
jgi:hypothetical protein